MASNPRCMARAWPQKFWDQSIKDVRPYDPRLDISEGRAAGPHDFDITDYILDMPESQALAIRDNDPSSDQLWRRWCSDSLAGLPYRGTPARVEAAAAIKDFLATVGGEWQFPSHIPDEDDQQ